MRGKAMIPLDLKAQAERYTTSAFVSPYMAYAASIHEGHPIHHEAVAMTLLSVMAGGGVRLRHFGGGDLYGNIWCMLVGGPGNLKSETIRLGERIAGPTFKQYRFADDFSPEKMISDLATRDTKTICFVQDEASYLFDQVGKDRNGGMAQLLAKVFDGRELQQARQGKETLIAEDYYACFLGGIQPDAFSAHMKDASIRRGLLSRFIWLPAPQETPTGRRVLWDREQENRLQNGLGLIQAAAQGCEMHLDEEADTAFQAWVAAHHRWMAGVSNDLATLGIRFRALPLKLAMLLYLDRRVAQHPETPLHGHVTIEADVLADACALALKWRRLLPEIFEDFSPTRFNKHYKRVLRYIQAHQPHTEHSDLLRAISADGIKTREVAEIIQQLREAKIVAPSGCKEKRGNCYHLDPLWQNEEAAKTLMPD